MKTNITITVLLALCLQPCKAGSPVRFSAVDSHVPFAEAISEIELIPLQTGKVNMLRTEIYCKNGGCPPPTADYHSQGPELIVTEDSYILVDPGQDRIYRYSLDGKFMNRIGHLEEGKEIMQNAQLREGGLYTYIYPDMMKRYDLDGTITESVKAGDIGDGGWTTDEGMLTWYGYGSGRPGRLGLWNGSDSTTFLPTDAKVIHITLGLPVFTQSGKDVLFIDNPRSTVMRYSKGGISSYVDIDLGEYALSDSYYTHDDAMSSAMEMMSRPFGLVQRYIEDGKNGFAEIFILSPDGKVKEYYGLFRKNRWTWFSPGTTNEHPFVNSFRTIKGKTLYCILNPDILDNMQEEFRAKIATPLESIPDDFIIAKIHLK